MGQISVSPNAGMFSRAHKTIARAMQAATSGDEIFVEAGTYREEIIVDKPVTLFNNSHGEAIIDGAVHVRARSAKLEGLTIRHRISESGLHIHPHADADIIKCIVHGQKTHNATVFAYEASISRFIGCTISSGKNGLAVDRANCTVIDCEIMNTQTDGLFVTAGATVRVENTHVHDCGSDGIAATEPETMLVVSGARVHTVGNNGILFLAAAGMATNCVVENCNVGVSLHQTATNVSGGEIKACREVGILVMGERAAPNISNVRLNAVGATSLMFLKGARGKLSSDNYESARGSVNVWLDEASAPTVNADRNGYRPNVSGPQGPR
jgi:Right handed beta helix region